MVHKVAKFIEKKALLADGAKVIVALSGGADSVALLLVLQKLDYCCTAVHCNFHLRGEESMRDEHFVRELCHRRNVPLTVVDFDTTAYAQEKKISIEMAARELRYEAFERLRKKSGATAIAVAHHRDDSSETVLLNLLRGTGIKGLRGIQPKNGYIVRPLLCVGRSDIQEYLHYRGEEYVTDSTNLQTDYTRNKVRLEILPAMSKINPSIIESIAQTAERVSEAEKVYAAAIAQGIERVKKGNAIDIEKLTKEPSPAALLHEILQPLGFNSTQIVDICSTMEREGCHTFESCGWRVLKDRATLIITQGGAEECPEIELITDGATETAQGTILCVTMPFNGEIERVKEVATLDYEKILPPLTLRRWRKGDRFAPFGMRGSKLVSDYMTDKKMNAMQKEQQLVVTDSAGTILWLVGERPAAHCSVTEETKKILRIEWRRI
jgi:tRNA(Ile)-lysidine synthase